jgi:hypothetical protein
VTRASKTLARMKANPSDWRIDALVTVAAAFSLRAFRPGGSHVVFRHPNGAMLCVPAHRPIKPVYIRRFVRLIEEGFAE